MNNKRLHEKVGILIALIGMALVTLIPHAYMNNWDKGAASSSWRGVFKEGDSTIKKQIRESP